ncbi:MAG: DUF1553 domain-containing protein [Verrucomicrobiae bacterium]|nr:DUF1553 domain-containing protein [Verrucomicrobiae bacterium]
MASLVATIALTIGSGSLSSAEEEVRRVDFDFSVRPIFSEHCLQCHGPDEEARKGKLRLDVRESALEKEAVVPGNPDESELIARIYSDDPDEVMPPPDAKTQLTEAEKAVLGKWVEQGAIYTKHWSFVPPQRPEIPELAQGKTEGLKPRSAIDHFVSAGLVEKGIGFAVEATPAEWLRRVTYDLTGLPPTEAELAAFESDPSEIACAQAVDRLLDSQAFGEQLGRVWLDAVRYADSMGRHEDSDMEVWPYRDWVIRSINENLPYDQFIIEQSAGDLLPNPTREQRVATIFNRMAQQSNESGSDEEEFRLDQVSDRVMTNGQAFLGLTLNCAKCHDHKFDPISQKEYWELASFFDNVQEVGIYSRYAPEAAPAPAMPFYQNDQEQRHLQARESIAKQEIELKNLRESLRPDFHEWLEKNGAPGPFWRKQPNAIARWLGWAEEDPRPVWEPKAISHFPFDEFDDRKIVNEVDPEVTGVKRSNVVRVKAPHGKGMMFEGEDRAEFEGQGIFHRWQPFSFALWMDPHEEKARSVVLHRSGGGTDDGRGYEIIWQDGRIQFALCHLHMENAARIQTIASIPVGDWTHVAVTYDGSAHAAGMRIFLNGEPAEVEVLDDGLRQDIIHRPEWGDILEEKEIQLRMGARLRDLGMVNAAVDDFWIFDRALSAAEVRTVMGGEVEPKPEEWFDWWLATQSETYRTGLAELTRLRRLETEIAGEVHEVMVMADLPKPRPTFVRIRGDFRERGDEVHPGTPESILPFPEDLPRNRLGFAQWLVHPENPLTSRVAVNRLWQLFFERGLVGTPEDFGTRGELPEYPALLDWLAVEFRESGWDVKALCRMIALSSVYRQSSQPADSKLLESDPDNRLLARGPARRLTAEEIRDSALAVSGLLVREIGGPSVRPYIPDRYYKDSALQQLYHQDHGDKLYRRSLYTFWRRTLPPPNLQAFDAPSRDVCLARRESTATPTQALVLLNDPQFTEAQRVAAEHLLGEITGSDSDRMVALFHRLIGRSPSAAELEVLDQAYRGELSYFRDHRDEAREFVVHAGEAPPMAGRQPDEVTALAMMARTLMSHTEFLTNH